MEISIFGRTIANAIELTNATDATTKNGKVKPPKLYNIEPNAGPKKRFTIFYVVLLQVIQYDMDILNPD